MLDQLDDIGPVITAAATAFCILLLLIKGLQSAGAFTPKYGAVPLLTKAEHNAWRMIAGRIPAPLILSPKVRLADIIKPARSETSRAGRRDLAKVWAKHIDLVVFDPRDCCVVLAIEIDDSSHRRKDRCKRDDFVNAALASADIPLLRIPLKTGAFQKARAELDAFFKAGAAYRRRSAA